MDEEQREIVSGLVDVIEQFLLLSLAQQAYLEFREGDAWERHVATVMVEQSPRIRGLIAPLRDALLGVPGESSQSEDWRRIVQELIDSANPPQGES
jgi:hypothetical protein